MNSTVRRLFGAQSTQKTPQQIAEEAQATQERAEINTYGSRRRRKMLSGTNMGRTISGTFHAITESGGNVTASGGLMPRMFVPTKGDVAKARTTEVSVGEVIDERIARKFNVTIAKAKTARVSAQEGTSIAVILEGLRQAEKPAKKRPRKSSRSPKLGIATSNSGQPIPAVPGC